MYDTQLVTELKNGGSDLIYRLIEPSPRKPTNRQDSQANPRLAVSRHAMDFILQLSSSLTRTDWEKHVSIPHGSHHCKIWQKGIMANMRRMIDRTHSSKVLFGIRA
jgi:hypothetical protein